MATVQHDLPTIEVTLPDNTKLVEKNAKPGTKAVVSTDPETKKTTVEFVEPKSVDNNGDGPPPVPSDKSPTEPKGKPPTEPKGKGPTEPKGKEPTEPKGKEPTEPTGKESTEPTCKESDLADDDYTTPYKPGDKIDDPMLTDLEDAGGTRNGDTVTMPDGTKYTKGNKLKQDEADKAIAAGAEKHEKGAGYYHPGDKVTDQMKSDLKDHGWVEDKDGTLTSPDGNTHIKPGDTELSPDQAERLTKGGTQKSPEYIRTDPASPANTPPKDYSKYQDLSTTNQKDYGYAPPQGADDHPSQISWGKNGDKDVGIVKEWDSKTGTYGVAGEVHKEDGKGNKYFAYNADQYDEVNKTRTLTPGKVW
jgi:hypothetical protein